MTDSHQPSTEHLPDVVRRFLDAQAAKDVEGRLGTFTPEAHVVDDGNSYAGTAEIRAWLNQSASQFEYTTTFLGYQETGTGTGVARNRIEGNFPGGIVDLRYLFTLDGDRIRDLVITV